MRITRLLQSLLQFRLLRKRFFPFGCSDTGALGSRSFAACDAGQGLGEYLIIVLLVAIVVLVSVRTFGRSVGCQFSNATAELSGDADGGCRTTSSLPHEPATFVPPNPPAPQANQLAPAAVASSSSQPAALLPPPPVPQAASALPAQGLSGLPSATQGPSSTNATSNAAPAIPTASPPLSQTPMQTPTLIASPVAAAISTPAATPTPAPTATPSRVSPCFVNCQDSGCLWTSLGCRWDRCWNIDVAQQPSYPLVESGSFAYRTNTSFCESISSQAECRAHFPMGSISWELHEPSSEPTSGDSSWDRAQANMWGNCQRRWPQ